ncbi:MAG: ABC transporter ATP-binding protein [Nitrospinaceae bacterium]|nr:MAG: ABC transporter ATP-binding protein [Nitrospinaceae bacterium]
MAEELLIHIRKEYPGRRIVFQARLPVTRGWTVLFGPSGSGKTTILRCIAGLERPDQGILRFNGETWFDSDRGLFTPPQKRRLGYFTQEVALFPHRTVAENIGYHLPGLSATEKKQRVDEMISLFNLDALRHRKSPNLSGGEKQRVALARTLARRPRLLLLDEPLSALDQPTRIQLRKELRDLIAPFNIPVLIVTHDRTESLTLGDRMIVLDEGRTLQDGTLAEVFSKPESRRVAQIVGMENVFPGILTGIHDGLAHIEAGGQSLTAVAEQCKPGPVMVGIRAEDITLLTGGSPETSARNRLHGRVANVSHEESLVRVTVDCGFQVDALITREALVAMNIAPGADAGLAVKATAIHLFPHR